MLKAISIFTKLPHEAIENLNCAVSSKESKSVMENFLQRNLRLYLHELVVLPHEEKCQLYTNSPTCKNKEKGK